MTAPRYAYRAARADGSVEFGTVEAASRAAASTVVADRGLFPIHVAVEAERVTSRRTLPARDLAIGLRVLATLLDAGLPVARALRALDDLAPDSWRPALAPLQQAVREGQGLAAAMGSSPVRFPPLVVGVVQAGEAGMGLGEAMRRAAEFTERAAATRAAIRGALAYPMVLATAGLGSLTLLATIVLPRFAAILGDVGQALPVSTRIVLAGGAAVRRFALPAFVATIVAGIVWRAWTATPGGRARWDAWMLGVPFFGRVRFAAATGRVCAALASLLESGVPVAPALLHAGRASGDAAIESRLLAAREEVVRGQRISRAAGEQHALTPTALKLVSAGEESGRLAHMLEHAGRLESERAELLVKSAVRFVEPALILVFGGVVALVAASLLQAIYSVRPGG